MDRPVKDDEDLVRAVVPVGAGLLVATKRSSTVLPDRLPRTAE